MKCKFLLGIQLPFYTLKLGFSPIFLELPERPPKVKIDDDEPKECGEIKEVG
jgi:hypothetical protein